MNATFRTTCAAAMMAVGSLALLPAAHAQKSQYQAERATCDGVQQDRQACIREAGAAAQAAQRNNLTSASPDVYRQNALARCDKQPAADRMACEQRVLGTGNTTIDGSVMGGGAIRETVTPVPVSTMPRTSTMPPQATMPAPSSNMPSAPATMQPRAPYPSSMPPASTMPPPAASPYSPASPMAPAAPR